MSRRGVLKAGVGAGLGLAAASVLGCSQPQRQETGVAPSGATATPAPKQPKAGGTLRYRMSGDPPNLDPHQNGSAFAAMVFGKVYSRLVIYRQGPGYAAGDTTLVPDLAEKWEQPDEVTYVFNLRKGVKFHDIPPVSGREVDATDVKYSFDRLRNPDTKSPVMANYTPINTVEAPDKYTAKFVTKEPYAAFMPFLAHSFAPYVVAKEAVEKFGDLKKNAIGTGPFILDSWERDIKLVYKKNPQYFIKGKPYLDQVVGLRIPDDSTAKAAYLSGEIDIGGPTFIEIDEFKKAQPDTVIYDTLSAVTGVVALMVWKPPFDDVRVRKAIQYCIDIKRIIDTVYLTDAVYGSIVSPLFPEWCLSQDELKSLYKTDVAKAKQLMAEAGYANGFKTTIYSNTLHGQRYKDMSQLVAQDLKQIGIDLSYEMIEYNAHLQKWANRNFDIYAGDVVPGPEMDEYTYAELHPKGSRNFANVNDSVLTALAEKQRMQVKEADRKKTVRDIQLRVHEVVAQIPAPMRYGHSAVRGYLKGYAPHFDLGDTRFMEIWLDK